VPPPTQILVVEKPCSSQTVAVKNRAILLLIYAAINVLSMSCKSLSFGARVTQDINSLKVASLKC